MKKIMAATLSLLACAVLLAGCNISSENNEEQSLKVYSFSGENEYISVSNGVIILDGKDEIDLSGNIGKIYGDILKDRDADKLTDNLWFELKTTNLRGEENTYQVQLETTEITKEVK